MAQNRRGVPQTLGFTIASKSESFSISNAGFLFVTLGLIVRFAPVLILIVIIRAAFPTEISRVRSQPTKAVPSGLTSPSLSSVLDNVSTVSASDPVSSDIVTAWNKCSNPSWISFCHCFTARPFDATPSLYPASQSFRSVGTVSGNGVR